MPRSRRLLAPWAGQAPAIYHCVSRVVNRNKVFHRAEKEEFVRLMRNYERFCGVRILTYCVMSNHFHLHMEVPPRPKDALSDEELCRRLRAIYAQGKVLEIREALQRCRDAGDNAGAEEIRESYFYRMWDLSQFMKGLKQAFTTWFNKRHNRCGTLWEGRFKNVLVEDGYAARVMGAYIDLNPVRAGMVDRPEDYRWCGYGEAVAGGREARAGITRLMDEFESLAGGEPCPRDWQATLSAYRVIVYSDGEERLREDAVSGEVQVARRGISREDVEKVRAQGGKLSLAEMLRCRVRALTDGWVFGSQKFVDDFHQAKRSLFGAKRKSGGRPIRGCDTELRTLRDLRKNALGS